MSPTFAQADFSREQSSQQIVDEREAREAAWYERTDASDVLNEMVIDHEEAFDVVLKTDDPMAIGRYMLAVRKALSLRYARGGDWPDTLRWR